MKKRIFHRLSCDGRPGLPAVLVFFFFFLSAIPIVAYSGCGSGSGGGAPASRPAPTTFEEAGGECITCHKFIEDAHPKKLLYCIDCHGGNDETRVIHEAHVQPSMELPLNPTILPVDYPDKDYLKFLNPSNLRVVTQTCGSQDLYGNGCHPGEVDTIFKSMMATTTGHLAGGAYQNGILPDRTAIWGNVDVQDEDGDIPAHRGALFSLRQVPDEDTRFPRNSIERHYSDVPRKICIRCHLWSRGKAVRGVPGQEGNYRSEGCAACHMPYANDGLSRSADLAIPKQEVGHPRFHTITRKIPTDQCAHCHTRGARIGLSYQGLAQLPPGTPTGPDFPGLTAEKIYGAYHVQDPDVNPPDIHSERGMHCIDCHVKAEIMGDGNIYGHMDQATEVECEDCHGSPSEYGDLVTDRGSVLEHVRVENGTYILKSKVTGAEHEIAQVRDFTDPDHPTFNFRASQAMTPCHLKENSGLECYSCHSSWQNNCWGCHFERDLGSSALDMIAGRMTPGHPRTDKKYFLNFKNFQMGYNAEGKVAPYVVGCQVLTTVTDEKGEKILDQAMPRTAAGLSGLSMNPVNPHTTRTTPRWCVECHRSEPSLGTGSETFTLARRRFFVSHRGSDPGLKVLDSRDPANATEIGFSSLTAPGSLAVKMNPVEGHAEFVYVGDEKDGVVTLNVSDPTRPQRLSTLSTSAAHDLHLTASHLYVAAGKAGLLVLDLANPTHPRLAAGVSLDNALAVTVSGTYAYVAAGDAGLSVIDVLDPLHPRVETAVDLNGGSSAPNHASDVRIFAHYGNPPLAGPKPFQILAYVADGPEGVRIVDVQDPTAPRLVATIPTTEARRLMLASVYDGGSAATRSLEHEYLYVADGPAGLRIFDVSNPSRSREVARVQTTGPLLDVSVVHAFVPPENKLYAYLSVEGVGLQVLDLSETGSPVTVGSYGHLARPGIGLAPERIRLDRMVDEAGRPIKDTSHDGARPFTREEMDRILRVEIGPSQR